MIWKAVGSIVSDKQIQELITVPASAMTHQRHAQVTRGRVEAALRVAARVKPRAGPEQ